MADVQSFINRLNKLTGQEYRLPTEAEWEYACRSGGKKEKYCGGNDLDSLAWYRRNSEQRTHPVARKQPNGLGLYDMSGNVWEWVQDCWNMNYVRAPKNGSALRVGECKRAVLRGGSLSGTHMDNRSAKRNYYNRGFGMSHYGFRLAKSRKRANDSTRYVKVTPSKPENKEKNEPQVLPSLTVQATPKDAQIRILNIAPKYHPGITLKPGKYHLEVRSRGHKVYRQWIDVSNEPVVLTVKLGKVAARKPYEPEMVVIPGGGFKMGDRRSQHKVNVRSFELGKYELTQSQWTAVMGSNPSAFSSCEECPVERVSWNDAQEYIHKLNQLTGKRYRLPSEAEWEFACRGGGKERSHCGTARNIDRFAWYKNTSNGKTHPVGKKSPNELLLYDMSGNVWEWVQDCWNESHVGSPRTGSAWLIGDCNRAVLRGGSWVVSERKLRAYHRYNKKRDFQYSTFGFRLAKDL